MPSPLSVSEWYYVFLAASLAYERPDSVAVAQVSNRLLNLARAADGREYTLTDTVGFVRNLPTQLVEAFRSTLEEVGQADVILHVVDAAHPDPVSQVQAVRSVIDTIEGASDIPELIALNKADLASPEQIALLRTVFPDAVPLSAHTGWGVEALRAALEDMLPWPPSSPARR